MHQSLIPGMNTNSEENYIKAIYTISRELKTGVTTGNIAALLNTKASSVTDMIQKLSDKSLVNYVKYQGVTLTPKGKKLAVKILRKHRLWELFLYQTLGFRWDEIHEIAEEMEHIKSDILIERLDRFLNHPDTDPHGDPIPDELGNVPERRSFQLSQLSKGASGIVVGVGDESSSFLTYLDKIGIQIGTVIKIIEKHEFDHSFEITINESQLVHIGYLVSQNILIAEK
jgi:DtxR family transcriptional regulator, Mn-dependent transcriptional regulator